jgi:hypothetical protein
MRYLGFLGAVLLLPLGVLAAPSPAPASLQTGQSLVVASSSPGNTYAAGSSVIVTSPVEGDLSALGGSVVVAAPAKEDVLIFAGSASVRSPVTGDLRFVAGHATIEGPIEGDVGAIGLSVRVESFARGSMFIAALTAAATGGSGGPVTIYGNTITLGGEFAGDVRVTAADRLVLLPDTKIRGALTYEAPLPAVVPESAHIEGGVHYTAASYLPGARVSRTLSYASIGIFLLVRVLAALVLAGLLAGLFPTLAEAILAEAHGRRVRHVLLTMLLGFAALVATPILIILLALTFIGLGLSILLAILYALLVLLGLVYAGITLGAAVSRRFLGHEEVLWRDGVLGTLALSLIALIPVLGPLTLVVLLSFSTGALLSVFFRFAFSHTDEEVPPAP